MERRLPLWLLAFGLGVAVHLPPASAGPNGESTQSGGTLRLVWGRAPDSLDPALAQGDVGSWVLLSLTCSRLFDTARDADTGRLRVSPEVVRKSIRSNGGRTYTFELKRTFRFHTGERVTAHNFVAAFNRDVLMRSPVVSWGFVQDIVGANAVIQGRAERVSGVQALGRYRLQFRLNRRAGDFIPRLTMPFFCPIPLRTPPESIDDGLPGSGRYYVADRVANRQIVLERNPFYRGRRVANPDRILWAIEPDPVERIRATERDEYDFVLIFDQPRAVQRGLVDSYGINRPGGRVFRPPSSFANFMFLFEFNPNRPAFKGVGQIPLKKAINYVIDRPELARAHGQAFRRSDRLLVKALSDSRRRYPIRGSDSAAAGKWLARAGRRPSKLTLYTSFHPFNVRNADVFIYSMQRLGIEVDPHYFEFVELRERLATQGEPWDVALTASRAFYPDPVAALLPLLRDTRWEARVDATNRIVSDAARGKAWADLEADLMWNDPPVAAYAEWLPMFLVSRSFGCWSQGQDLDFAAVCKK